MAILPQFVYTGDNGSVTSDQALSNPYSNLITLAPGPFYLPFLANAVTDTHFFQRDRMGRFVTFIARLIQDGNITASLGRGIAVNEKTAILVDENGIGRVPSFSCIFIFFKIN